MLHSKKEIEPSQTKSFLNAVTLASSMGLHMVSGILIGIFFGYGIDYLFDSYPWCTGFGLFFGIITSFRMVWLDTNKLIQEQEKQRE